MVRGIVINVILVIQSGLQCSDTTEMDDRITWKHCTFCKSEALNKLPSGSILCLHCGKISKKQDKVSDTSAE